MMVMKTMRVPGLNLEIAYIGLKNSKKWRTKSMCFTLIIKVEHVIYTNYIEELRTNTNYLINDY
jgi:hypothetical protein